MPQYELRGVNDVKSWTEGTDIKSTCVVVSGIVGDTYNYNRWDNLEVTNPNTMTGAEIEASIQAAAAALVATEYPNT
jgi:hypothetical protein